MVVKVELPTGKLGLTAVGSPPAVGAVRADSPVAGQVAPGDIIVSLTRPGLGDVDTTNLDGQAVMDTLVAFAKREGRSLTVEKDGMYRVGVPARALGVSFVDGTCTVHAVKPTSPLLGVTLAGDTLLSVNGQPVTPTTILRHQGGGRWKQRAQARLPGPLAAVEDKWWRRAALADAARLGGALVRRHVGRHLRRFDPHLPQIGPANVAHLTRASRT